MLKFPRITCIWICFVSCLLDYADVEVHAVPLEYFDDHEQLSYDMDTEQSKAKYDPRILSEQLLEKQDQHDADDDDDDWPQDRAASCYSGAKKYTHGQKVPRDDPCEVCLCVDGEIFCWWKKCEGKRKKSDAHSAAAANGGVKKTKKKTPPTTIKTTTTTIRSPVDKERHVEHLKKTKKLLLARMQKKVQMQQKSQPAASSSSSSSASPNKILNFPENLPSVLYYDYNTEEHHHHQHQHQHLKRNHQMQMEQLKKQQQQQQQRYPSDSNKRQQKEHMGNFNVGNENVNNDNRSTEAAVGAEGSHGMVETSITRHGKSPTPRSQLKLLKEGPSIAYDAVDEDGKFIENNKDYQVKLQSDVAGGKEEPTGSRNNNKISLQIRPSRTPLATKSFSIDDIKRTRLNINNAFRSNTNSNHRESNGSEQINFDDFHRVPSSSAFSMSYNSQLNLEKSQPKDGAQDENDISAAVTIFNKNENMPAVGHRHLPDDIQIISTLQQKDVQQQQEHPVSSQEAEADVVGIATSFRSSFNDFSSEFNSSSVNLDLILTASGHQGRQKQPSPEPIIIEANTILNSSSRSVVSSTNDRATDVATSTTGFSQLPEGTSVAGIDDIFVVTSEAATTLAADMAKECIVMGASYKIGDILPQETGNCLQCICIGGSTKDDTPRVTCSPHNCPPLVLPDLFDATGY